MSTPAKEIPDPEFNREEARAENADDTGVTKTTTNGTDKSKSDNLTVDVGLDTDERPRPSPSQTRERANRVQDELAMLEIEREVSDAQNEGLEKVPTGGSMRRSRSRRSEPVDEFDAATQPLHDQAAVYKPVDNPTTNFAVFFKKIHESSFVVRYITYITPLALIILIPLLVGGIAYPDANVGGVQLLWFCIWLEIFWLTLWAGRIVAKCIPAPLGIVASLFTNNAKKWRDMGKQLELPASLFFWFLAVEISFLPTMKNHHIDHDKTTRNWETVVNKIIIAVFVGLTLNFIEKIIIQLIAISFHLRTYADRIEINKFQIGSLAKLYAFSKEKIALDDREFEQSPNDGPSSGAKTPLQYADKAQRAAREALSKFGDVAGAVAGDFTGRKSTGSKHPHQVVLALLSTTSGSQVLARRLYRTFVRDGFETVFAGDLKSAFDNEEEAEAAFTMFDKDMNGDISMEELEAACVEIGRERKSITASLKDLDSVVSKLDDVFMFIVFVIFILVLLSLISASASGVLASAGSALLALSWLFSATAQEFLQSVIFVFVKHPFDVGDRVTIYGNTGTTLTGDDYFVKEVALLYTEFKKMQGHVVQAPNSYLNTLFILNQRRSGGLAEAVPIIIRFGTTLEQIDMLRMRLLEFVRSEKREYQGNILTELREVTENYSITLNVVFFYKSNWQNELLRLQRRNKFICHMMLTLQEVGIEGPRMNAVGARQEVPYYLNHQGAPPSYQSHADDATNPPSDPNVAAESRDALGSLPSSSMQHHPSILRRGTTSSMRSRSGSNAKKHVDFSLGMSEFSSGDMLGDVYSDRSTSRVDEVVRNANRESAERREGEKRLEEEQRRASAEASTRGRASQESHRTAGSHGNTSLLSPSRPSVSSSVHRNRFLSRMGGRSRDGSAQGSGRDFIGEDDLEQGRYTGLHPEEHVHPGSSIDPRSHSVSTSAVNVHDDYGSMAPYPAGEPRRPEEHEMTQYRPQP